MTAPTFISGKLRGSFATVKVAEECPFLLLVNIESRQGKNVGKERKVMGDGLRKIHIPSQGRHCIFHYKSQLVQVVVSEEHPCFREKNTNKQLHSVGTM